MHSGAGRGRSQARRQQYDEEAEDWDGYQEYDRGRSTYRGGRNSRNYGRGRGRGYSAPPAYTNQRSKKNACFLCGGEDHDIHSCSATPKQQFAYLQQKQQERDPKAAVKAATVEALKEFAAGLRAESLNQQQQQSGGHVSQPSENQGEMMPPPAQRPLNAAARGPVQLPIQQSADPRTRLSFAEGFQTPGLQLDHPSTVAHPIDDCLQRQIAETVERQEQFDRFRETQEQWNSTANRSLELLQRGLGDFRADTVKLQNQTATDLGICVQAQKDLKKEMSGLAQNVHTSSLSQTAHLTSFKTNMDQFSATLRESLETQKKHFDSIATQQRILTSRVHDVERAHGADRRSQRFAEEDRAPQRLQKRIRGKAREWPHPAPQPQRDHRSN